MKNLKIILFIILWGSLVEVGASARETLKTSYLELQLPPNWTCKKSYSDWICRSNIPSDMKRNLIILNSKIGSQQETFFSFKNLYGQPLRRTIPAKNGRPASQRMSQLISSKVTAINGMGWVDSIHLGSEIPNYYTRYLVTRHGPLLIMLTISSHKSQWGKQSKSFADLISSINLFPIKTELIRTQGGGIIARLMTKRNLSFALVAIALILGVVFLWSPSPPPRTRKRKK